MSPFIQSYSCMQICHSWVHIKSTNKARSSVGTKITSLPSYLVSPVFQEHPQTPQLKIWRSKVQTATLLQFFQHCQSQSKIWKLSTPRLVVFMFLNFSYAFSSDSRMCSFQPYMNHGSSCKSVFKMFILTCFWYYAY